MYLGSSIFFVAIMLSPLVFGTLIILCAFFPFSIRYKISQMWVHTILWGAKIFCGLDYQVEGLENLRGIPAAIALSKHESAWETLALRVILPPQSVLLKRSLLRVPVWGWAMSLLKPIAIDRSQKRAALKLLLDKGSQFLQEGVWVLVFPEGTRAAPGEALKFNVGGAMLAEKTGYPVIPIALNSGSYWPRYSFLKYPGTIKVKIGPPISSENRKATDINNEASAWISEAMSTL
ncbi:1-acyl-sn-glycerol-3-phosphate acyltransferase [Methylosoma difficile]